MERFRKAGIVFVLIFLIGFVSFVSCGAEKNAITHTFEVAENEFELRGCTWNVEPPTRETVIFQTLEDGTTGTPYYPEQGFFYIVNVNVNPGDTPYLNLRDVRYQLVDVHGNVYLPARSFSAMAEYEKKTGLKSLVRANGIVREPVEGFVMIDGPGNLLGITLEIFNTGQTPEEKIAIVDLKQ
ncbi:MAG: hypothetical protein R2883_01710 [Caldisericia bacterium]